MNSNTSFQLWGAPIRVCGWLWVARAGSASDLAICLLIAELIVADESGGKLKKIRNISEEADFWWKMIWNFQIISDQIIRKKWSKKSDQIILSNDLRSDHGRSLKMILNQIKNHQNNDLWSDLIWNHHDLS